MFKRLFGQTEQEQMRFLRIRSFATVALWILFFASIIVINMFSSGSKAHIAINNFIIWIVIGILAMGFVWGVPALNGLFGVSSFFASTIAVCSGVPVLGLLAIPLALVFAAFAAAILGIFVSLIGILWYVILCIKNKRL